MSGMIRIADLLPGDVLLYRGTSVVSQGIQFFDGTELSHAGLYLGDGWVGEALARGLVRNAIHTSLRGSEWVKAYRLKERPPDMGPVLDKAAEYLDQGNRYGYEQLLLLGLLCLTRKLEVTPSLRVLIRRVLDAAASVLTRLVSEQRQPMICSEFVYRAFDEALPEHDDVYSLRVNELLRGMPGRVREGFPVPLGQGVHPDSLLAFLSSESSGAWHGDTDEPSPRAAHVPPDVDDSALEQTIASYLVEVEAEPSEARSSRGAHLEGLMTEDVRTAAERFAVALHKARRGEPVPTAGTQGAPASRSLVSEYLSQTAADFVTPGDLYGTQSLLLVGQIKD